MWVHKIFKNNKILLIRYVDVLMSVGQNKLDTALEPSAQYALVYTMCIISV